MKIKEKILQELKNVVRQEKIKIEALAKTARAGAIGDDMKSEGKYDTRAIEAGYLASAQLSRLQELEQELQLLESFTLRDFAADETAAMGALLKIEFNGKTNEYFLCSSAGGTMLNIDGRPILVISVFSPLGSAVIGLNPGDDFEIENDNQTRTYILKSVI